MSAVCGRCKEGEVVFECADCVGSKRRGELLPLCDPCNTLIHIGFLEDHQVISVAIKLKKADFQEQLKTFKSQEKSLQLKLKEVSYAKQDIEQRSQYNQQVITQAFQAVLQALKQKELELITPVKRTGKEKTTLLVECEKSVGQVTSEFKSLFKEAEKLLQGNLVEFAEQHEQIAKKLQDFEVGRVSKPFPTLGHPAHLDITSLLQSIKDLCLQSVEDEVAADEDVSKGEKEVGVKQSSQGAQKEKISKMQSPQEGDSLQVYVESRMDTKGHFWVSKNLSEDVANLYENLSFRIRQDILQNPIAHVEIEEGMLCCSQFQEDHRWYRGRVHQINRQKGVARIRWLDYAHDNEVPLSAIQPLKEEFQTLPFQAMECSLFEPREEDVPHQARWEFSDHVANALLDCKVLRLVPPESKYPVYIVDLEDKYKDVNIKERVKEKIEEASGKKDSIQCRDIRYMKDFTPAISKTSKKDTTKKPKDAEEGEEKKTKLPTKAVESSDAKKNEDGETENKEDKMDDTQSATTRPKEEAQPETAENQEGVTDAGTSDPKQEKTEEVKDTTSKVESREEEKQVDDNQSGPTQDSVKILKRGDELPDQGKPAAEQIHPPSQEDPPACQDGTPNESQQDDSSLNDDPKCQSSGVKQREKAPADAAADQYSLEPGEDDEEDNPNLIEINTRRADQAMAHNPENMYQSLSGGRERAVNGDGPQYHEGSRPYNQYGGGGFHMSTGMLEGGYHPPTALGLNPVESSTESNQSSQPPSKDHGSSTGDGFKIVVDSSFNICIATPLSDNGRFWASRLRGPAQESQLRRLMHDISLPAESLSLSDLKEVKVVSVQAPSGQWCRARVEGINDNKVNVRYVDFGQADVVEENRIKALSVNSQLFPFQAMELSIATQNHPHFSEQAKEAFMKYTQSRTLSAKVVASESKIVFVKLSYIDENHLVYDISSAILKVNQETSPQSGTDVKKEKPPPAGNSHHRGHRDQNDDHPYNDDHHRPNNPYEPQYDHHGGGGGGGERCFVCNNFGHLSYDCPKKGDPQNRNYRNKGGNKKQQNWGRKNRKY
ncbi:uncharacterized protein [Asterias amurensis]|uniref:uncharacterized protein isoform X1 n=1 Tax=Asterias amurensis TaxID=7602 RepID=UPI003AB396CE